MLAHFESAPKYAIMIQINLPSMKQIALLLLVIGLMAAGCTKTELKREYPSSPKESYEPLPR